MMRDSEHLITLKNFLMEEGITLALESSTTEHSQSTLHTQQTRPPAIHAQYVSEWILTTGMNFAVDATTLL